MSRAIEDKSLRFWIKRARVASQNHQEVAVPGHILLALIREVVGMRFGVGTVRHG